MRHKRYMGDFMSAYIGMVLVGFIVLPALAPIAILNSEVSFATVFLSVMCFACSAISIYATKKAGCLAFSWGSFEEAGITVKTLLQKKHFFEYKKCADVGVGYYIHGVLNSTLGSKIVYIYLSYYKVDEKYKSQMNLLKPTKDCIRIGFRRSTYEYLLKTMPPRQAAMPEASYSCYRRHLRH